MKITGTDLIYLPELDMSYEKLKLHLKSLYNIEITKSKEYMESNDLKKNDDSEINLGAIPESPDFISQFSQQYDDVLQKREDEKFIDQALQELYGELVIADVIKDKQFMSNLEGLILTDDVSIPGVSSSEAKVKMLRDTLDWLDANKIVLRNKEFMDALRVPAKIDLIEFVDASRENNLIDILSDKEARGIIQQIQDIENVLRSGEIKNDKDRVILLKDHSNLIQELKKKYNYEWDNNFVEVLPDHLEIELEAVPNAAFESSTHEGSITIKKHKTKIASIQDGRELVASFIDINDLSEGNFPNPHLYYNGKVIGYITYNLKVYNKDNSPMEYEGGGGVNSVVHSWNTQAHWQLNLLDYSSFGKLPEEGKAIDIKYKDGSVKQGIFSDGKFKRSEDWNEKYGVIAWRYKSEAISNDTEDPKPTPGKVSTAQEKKFASYWYKIVNSDKDISEIVPEQELQEYLGYITNMLTRYFKHDTGSKYAKSQMNKRYNDLSGKGYWATETDKDAIEQIWKTRYVQAERHGILSVFGLKEREAINE